MDPRFESWIEELLPLVSDMKHERSTEKEMLEPETCSHSPEVEQIPVPHRDRVELGILVAVLAKGQKSSGAHLYWQWFSSVSISAGGAPSVSCV